MWGSLCLCSYARLQESSLFVALSVVRIRVMRVMMCEAAVFCARVTLRLTPHSQPNVFLILSIPHHQSLSSDSNCIREHTHTHTTSCKCVTCIQACAVKTEIVPDAVMFRCMSFTTSGYVCAHFNSPLSCSKEFLTIYLFHASKYSKIQPHSEGKMLRSMHK